MQTTAATCLTNSTTSLTAKMLGNIDAHWSIANSLSVRQLYLYDKPLFKELLTISHLKPLVIGHWGTAPGQNSIHVHFGRAVEDDDLDMVCIAGPGHGGPAIVGDIYRKGI